MSTPRKPPAVLIGAEGWKFLRELIAAPDRDTFERLMSAAGKPRTRAFDRYRRSLEIAWRQKRRPVRRKRLQQRKPIFLRGRPSGSYQRSPQLRALAADVVRAVREKRDGRSRLPAPVVMKDFIEPLVRDLARRRGMKLNAEQLHWLCNVAPKTGRFIS